MTTIPGPTDLLLARRELALERKAKFLREENLIYFYSPHPKQVTFHSNANFHYRYARTGNRFGKSEMGAAEDVAYALGFRPWIPEGNPLRTLGIPQYPTKGLIVTTDWDKSTEVFTELEPPQIGKLFKYIPKHRLGRPTKNHSGAIDRIPVRHQSGGWSLIRLDTVKSYKQNPTGQESGDNDWIHVDEPIPEGMWKAVARGLVDRKGHAWFTCTPIEEPWLDLAFIPDLQDQTSADVPTTAFPETSRFIMTGTMDDNPYNDPESIALYMSFLTDEEKDARRRGIPLAYSGLVYKEFIWDEHVYQDADGPWKKTWTPPADHCIRIAVDYHFRKNDAVLFTAISPPPEERIYIYHEIWKQLLVRDEVDEIKYNLRDKDGVEREYQPVLMEPLAETPNKVTDITPMDEYRRCGLAVLPATKDPVNGVRAVKALLKMRDKKGRAVVQISPLCRRFLFEIARGFVWDGDQNKPIKKNDDMMENFYRLALHGLTYVEPSSAVDYKIPPFEIPFNVLSFPDELAAWRAESEKTDKQKRYAERYRR
jgi:hypothetical protein